MYLTAVYCSRKVLCKTKKFLRKKYACEHISRKVSFVLTFLLKKPFYCHLLTNNHWSIWKMLETNPETSQEGPEAFLSSFFSTLNLMFC